MNYGYKVTTVGRELLAALLATGEDLEITRVAVGSGRVTEDTNLADMTDLVQYVAEGKVVERSHQDNVLYLTIQYASNFTPDLGAFYLSEFIVQAKHPVSGETVTLLYATLGDYIQPVNGYSETLAPDIRNYPIVLAISDEINVSVTTPSGLVTYDQLLEAVQRASSALAASFPTIIVDPDFVIPASGWSDASALGELAEDDPYTLYLDVPYEAAAAVQSVRVDLDKVSQILAGAAGCSQSIEVLDGVIRFWSKTAPAADLTGTLTLIAPSGGGDVVISPGISEDMIATDEAAAETIEKALSSEGTEDDTTDEPTQEIESDEVVLETVKGVYGL